MIIYSDNRPTTVRSRNQDPYPAWETHVADESTGRHLFVIATNEASLGRLMADRARIAGTLRRAYGIDDPARLEYIERHPDGTLYRIHLDQVGDGPGTHGEAPDEKRVADRVDPEAVTRRLGRASLPGPPGTTPDPPPALPEPLAGDEVDLNTSGLPSLSRRERDEVRRAFGRPKPRL